MSQSRRDFIKFVVAGSVTAGCPIDIESIMDANSVPCSRFLMPHPPVVPSFTANTSKCAIKCVTAIHSIVPTPPAKPTS